MNALVFPVHNLQANPFAARRTDPAHKSVAVRKLTMINYKLIVRLPHLMTVPVRSAACAACGAQHDVFPAVPQPKPANPAIGGPFVVVENHPGIDRRAAQCVAGTVVDKDIGFQSPGVGSWDADQFTVGADMGESGNLAGRNLIEDGFGLIAVLPR